MLRLEWLILRRDRAVLVAGLFFAALVAISIANGIEWRSAQQRAHGSAAKQESNEYERRRADVVRYKVTPPAPADPVIPNLTDPRSAYVVGQAGRTLLLPLLPLSALSAGQFDLLPLREGVSIRSRQRTVADKYGIENPLSLLAGRFDLAFVIVWLMPLFLIALTYNLLSLEREQGTLALLRSQPASLARILGLKIGLRAGLTSVILIGIVALVHRPISS